jgi:thiamine transport system permease protein
VQGNVGFGNSVGISAKRLDRRDTPLAVLGIALFTLFVLPIWNVFQKVFSEDSNIGIGSELLIAAANSARNILIVVLLSGMIGTYVAYQLVRTSGWLQKLLSFSYLAPIGISTVLVGLGYLLGFSSFRSSWLVIPLAETVLALPLVVRIVASALAAVEESQLEQAKVDGASLWQIFRFVEAPAISNSVRAGLGFAAIIALGDFGASAFLSFGDQETLPILLYRLFSRPGAENYQNAMSLTALLVIASIALVLVTSLKVGRRTQRAFR